MSDNENVVVKYSSYTDAQKRATQKYRSNNKDKVNEQRKQYYKQRKESDPNFLEYKRAKAREYYQKKKQLKNADEQQALIDQNTPEATNEPESLFNNFTQQDFLEFQEAVLNQPLLEPIPEPKPEPKPEPEAPTPETEEPQIETVEPKPKKKRAPRKKKTIDV